MLMLVVLTHENRAMLSGFSLRPEVIRVRGFLVGFNADFGMLGWGCNSVWTFGCSGVDFWTSDRIPGPLAA